MNDQTDPTAYDLTAQAELLRSLGLDPNTATADDLIEAVRARLRAANPAGLSRPQQSALHAIACGSGGVGARPQTIESLRKRGLIKGMEGRWSSPWVWRATAEGHALVDQIRGANER